MEKVKPLIESGVPEMFFLEMDAKAQADPDFKILTFENSPLPDEVVSYGDILANGCKLAKKMQNSGFGKGDVLAVFMRNHPEFVYAFYAANILGCTLLPIDSGMSEEGLRLIFKNSNTKGLIFTSEFIKKISPVLKDMPQIEIIGVANKSGMPAAQEFPCLERVWEASCVPEINAHCSDPDTIMEIMYPLDSHRGDSKMAVFKISHLGLFGQIAKNIFQYKQEDKLYTALPLAQVNFQAITLIPALFLGIPAVISSGFARGRVWEICRRYHCTIASFSGEMMEALFVEPEKFDDADIPVRLVLSSNTPQAIWKAFERRFKVFIHEWYGSIEGPFAHKAPGIGPVGSFGKPLDGVMEMKVIRKDGSACSPLEAGEIVCRFMDTWVGADRPDAERESQKIDSGWLKSGDIGYCDNNGWFFLISKASRRHAEHGT